jgi:hypothetical protein
VSDKDPATRFERDEFMQERKEGATVQAYLKELLLAPMDVRYDCTQH